MELNQLLFQIGIKYLNPEMPKITFDERGDWLDLRSAERHELKAGEFKLINLGIAMKLPTNYEGYLLPRSSTFKNYGILLANSMGIIDNTFCGNEDIWHMPAYCTRNTIIEKFDRICQFRIQARMPKVELVELETLPNINRSGFGSSGVK